MQTEPMTQWGFEKIRTELEHLKNIERAQIAVEIAEARSHGDLSENAEYDAAKEKQAHLEKRIAYLQDMITKAKVIDPTVLKHEKVCFGSTVKVMNLDTEQEYIYTIVGAIESNPTRGLVSFNSPISRVMIGKEEGDVFGMELPNGSSEIEIIEICYKEISFE